MNLSIFIRGTVKFILILFYLLLFISVSEDAYTLCFYPQEYGNLFGNTGFGWQYSSKSVYAAFGVFLAAWSLLGIYISTRLNEKPHAPWAAGHILATAVILCACAWI